MKIQFKDIRDLIYCECIIIKGKNVYPYIHTHEHTIFDEDEVIGIRAQNDQYSKYDNNIVLVVSLKDEVSN